MDDFLKQLDSEEITDFRGFSIEEFIIALIASAILSMVISLVYRQTHTGLSYSRSFVLSIIIMSVTVSFIMLIIGSNLARAFSLVGALSIVRYRNAIKDTQDISYIFLAIAVGMACGTKLYGMALTFTLFTSLLMLLLNKISFGNEGRVDRLFVFKFPQKNREYNGIIDSELKTYSRNRSTLLSSEYVADSQLLTYEVDMPTQKSPHDFLEDLRAKHENLEVKVLSGFDQFNV